MKFLRKITGHILRDGVSSWTIWNELSIFSTGEKAQTGRRIDSDSLHEWTHTEQID